MNLLPIKYLIIKDSSLLDWNATRIGNDIIDDSVNIAH